jgi:glycerophosphoryl diester phosphodiesterase
MPLVIAHRGASAAAQENTITAFELARELGADWVELDVRRAACGTPVVHHDADLSDGRLICDLQATALPEHVSTLHDVLLACAPMGVDIEIKSDPDEPDYDDDHMVVDATVAVAEAVLPADRVLVSSFDMSAVNRAHDVSSHVPTGFITSDDVGVEVSVGRAVAHGHVVIKPADALITARFVEAAHDAGLRVFPWTIDDPHRIAALADLGVDGIITNRPDLARQVLG